MVLSNAPHPKNVSVSSKALRELVSESDHADLGISLASIRILPAWAQPENHHDVVLPPEEPSYLYLNDLSCDATIPRSRRQPSCYGKRLAVMFPVYTS